MKRARVGCSGWMYRDWRGVVYPEKLPQRLWLERYAEAFVGRKLVLALPAPTAPMMSDGMDRRMRSEECGERQPHVNLP